MARNSSPKDRHEASPPETKRATRETRRSYSQASSFVRSMLRQSAEALIQGRQKMGPVGFGHVVMGTWATLGAIATVFNLGVAEVLERQTQTLFFQMRGKTSPPESIVILAIDEPSLEQGQFYAENPEQYSHLEPLAQWPWQRTAYAIAIEQLMNAGARAVALDLIFDSPSSWGSADDERLQQAIQRHSGRVTLASSYEDQILAEGQGSITQLIEPDPLFRTEDVNLGFINFWIDLNGRIHRLSEVFPLMLASQYPDQADYFTSLSQATTSFDQATLESAQVPVPQDRGTDIAYVGPAGTFPQFSFWTVLEPETWEQHVENGDFKDKIVLVGPTATLFKDIHNTPFGPMPGVEIHANAIATLLTGQALDEALPNRYVKGIWVFVLTLGSGVFISRPERITHRAIRGLGMISIWVMAGFVAFTGMQLLIPVGVPLMVVMVGTVSYAIAGLAREKLHKLKLRKTLKQYASSPIIREIISQQDDLQDLLQEREQDTLGKLLVGRYQLVEVLGAGGFGETYIGADLQRPNHPLCVVKQLRPVSNDLKLLHLSKRLFQREAETLERLGRHDHIPQLLAYFEEGDEFYLVQELIDGQPLRQELLLGQPLSEEATVKILVELLKILDFIHSCGVIHRDIKPSNIIRRKSDQKLVLIDFGAVKEIQSQLSDDQTQFQTIGIGTRGYMPSEQYIGNPRFNSDIYAVGVVGIQAITGLPPDRLDEDSQTGELIWQKGATLSPELAAILTKMTRYTFMDRYQSAREALSELEILCERYGLQELLHGPEVDPSHVTARPPSLLDRLVIESWSEDDQTEGIDESTLPWPSSVQRDKR